LKEIEDIKGTQLRRNLFGDCVVFQIGKKIPKSGDCPFCEGNEYLTSPEIAAVRDDDAMPNKPGWRIRVNPKSEPHI